MVLQGASLVMGSLTARSYCMLAEYFDTHVLATKPCSKAYILVACQLQLRNRLLDQKLLLQQ
jgi:hypothetical protein